MTCQSQSVCKASETAHLNSMSSPSLTVDTPATEMSAGRKLAAWQREKMSGVRHVAFIMMTIFTYNLDLDDVVSTHCYFRRRIIRFGENTAVISTGKLCP